MFENIDDLKVKAKLVVSKATVHLRQCRDELAWAEYKEAIKLARELPYPDVEAEASFGLGILSQERGDLDQAVRYLTYSARTYGRLKKLQSTKAAYEELLKTLYMAERWDELLYEAAYANRSHILSSPGRAYALSALSNLGRSPAEYPDLFGSAPDELTDLPETRTTLSTRQEREGRRREQPLGITEDIVWDNVSQRILSDPRAKELFIEAAASLGIEPSIADMDASTAKLVFERMASIHKRSGGYKPDVFDWINSGYPSTPPKPPEAK